MARKLIVEILGDTSNFEKATKRADRTAQGFTKSLSRVSRGALAGSGAFRSLGHSVAYASSAFLGAAGLTAVMTQSISAASNLAEQTSKTEAVFGSASKSVEAFAKTAADAYGQSSDQALEAASSFGALLKPLGVTGAAAAQQSIKLTKMGADLASFYNTSVQDALDAIRSGIIGEAEPLRRYGIQLSEARVQAKALAMTHKDSAKQLTVQDKVLARQAIIYRDAATAQGDFARTGGGLANQTRKAQANFRNLQIAIGTALIPTLLQLVRSVNQWLRSGENQKRVVDAVRTAANLLVTAFKTLRSILTYLNTITGSTKHTLELLLGVFIAFKTAQLVATFAGIATSIAGIGTNAAGATPKVAGLGAALKGLAGLYGLPALAGLLAAEATKKLPGFEDYFKQQKDFTAALKAAKSDSERAAIIAKLQGDPRALKTGISPDDRRRVSRATRLATRKPRATGGAAGAPTLTAAQQRQIGLAGEPSLGALRAQQAYDKSALAFLEKRFKAGKISAKKYTDARIRLENDLAQQNSAIASIVDAQAQAAKEAAAKAGQFTMPPRLELAQARAEALGLKVEPILKKMRAAARAALKSGRLTIESQINAWNAITSINEQLKQGADRAAHSLTPRRMLPGGGRPVPFALAGGGGVTVHGDIHLHGVQRPRDFEDAVVKRTKARPHKRRGP